MPKKNFLLILIPVLIYSIYWGNLKPLMASRAVVAGRTQQALSYNTFVNHEFRKILAQQALKSEDVKFVIFVTQQMEINIKERPLDVKSYILITHLYYRLGLDKKARWAAERALELAPNRQDVFPPFFSKSKKYPHE